MPELPEVETIRKTLQTLVKNKTIVRTEVFWPKIIKLPDDVNEFIDTLKGETIHDVGRRGKFLLFETDHYTLVSHLRMEGKYGLFSKEEPIAKHTHVIFEFSDQTQLRYHDVRKFGTMHLFKKGTEFDSPPLKSLGPEPFSTDFTVEWFSERLAKTTRKIKAVLLDQHVLVGLGNIYVDEALFRANIHPERRANTLSATEIRKLRKEIVATLEEAVQKGGSTIRSYVNSQGQIGMFQLELLVYGRDGEKCKNCNATITKIRVAGRGTHFCLACQPKDGN